MTHGHNPSPTLFLVVTYRVIIQVQHDISVETLTTATISGL